MKNPSLVRSAAAAAVAGLTLTIGGVSATQFAEAQSVKPPSENQNIIQGAIDPDKAVSLTITKHLDPQQAPVAGTGLPGQTPGSRGLVQGVTFTAQKLNIANVKPEDVSKITGSDLKGAVAEGDKISGTTGEDGKVTLQPTEQGIYLVTESITGENVTVNGQTIPGTEISKSAPFVVSLPYYTAEQNGWNYAVEVYPKNYSPTITKEVTDENVHVGGELTYTLNSPIPFLEPGQVLRKFEVYDQLDTDNLVTENFDVATKVAVTVEGLTLTRNDDYTVAISEGREISVKFTEAGRTKLATAGGKNVVVTIMATVKAIEGTDGVAYNDARVIVNYPGEDRDVEKTSDPVKSYWGTAKFKKVDADNEETTLSGAEFALYRCAGTETQADQMISDNRVSVAGENTWTSGPDGTVTISGIKVGDWTNNGAANPEIQYCLVETKAPAGYNLTQEVFAFQLLATEDQEGVTQRTGTNVQPASYTREENITNERNPIPNLPMTGGMGVGILAALGVIIAGLAAYVARRNSTHA